MGAGEREYQILGHLFFFSLAEYAGIGVYYKHLRILYKYLK